MAGTLNKGSLVKGTGGAGGGSASFPMIVTDSGSSLPSASGYQLNDTFLNTTDKKIYKTVADGYVFNTGVSGNTGYVDLTTGILSSQINYGLSRNTGSACMWTGDKEFNVHFKLTSFGEDENFEYYIFLTGTGASYPDELSFFIKNKKLYIRYYYYSGSDATVDNKELIFNYELQLNTEYFFKITKTGNSATAKLFTGNYEETLVASNTLVTQNWAHGSSSYAATWFGSPRNNNVGKPFTIGDIYLVDTSGEFLKPNTDLFWDNGTSLTDKTEYADKTNGILYLYEDTELIQIPDIDLSNYKLKATTTTIDTASVTVSEIKANTNYVFSNNAITNITLSGCETSFEETTIEFTTGSTAPSVTDNSGITWMDNFDITNLSANKSYLIVIFNKLGFVKEY